MEKEYGGINSLLYRWVPLAGTVLTEFICAKSNDTGVDGGSVVGSRKEITTQLLGVLQPSDPNHSSPK